MCVLIIARLVISPLLLLQCQSKSWLKEEGDANELRYHTDDTVSFTAADIYYHYKQNIR